MNKRKRNILAMISIGSAFILLLCLILGRKVYNYLSSAASQYASAQASDNKSAVRFDAYEEEPDAPTEKRMHISFDDTISVFKDLTDHASSYSSAFENSTLKWYKKLHDKYGAVITCYVYYEQSDFSLKKCTKKFAQEFAANADWLRFGFHALNSTTIYTNADAEKLAEDYTQTVTALTAVVGGTEAIDNCIRLHGFGGSAEALKGLTGVEVEPVTALLSADDSRQSYALNEKENEYIYSHDFMKTGDGLYMVSTDLRAEYIRKFGNKITELNTSDAWNNQLGIMEVFSHEWKVDRYNVRYAVEHLCKWGAENGYTFEFFEDYGID